MFCATKRIVALITITAASVAYAADLSEKSLREADAEQMRIIVEADADAQQAFMHDNYILNGPAGRILRKDVVVEMLARGKIASERFERVIEGVAITGNVGIVMGRERVKPAPGSELNERYGDALLDRRFTNVFLFENDRWRFLARQATVVGTTKD